MKPALFKVQPVSPMCITLCITSYCISICSIYYIYRGAYGGRRLLSHHIYLLEGFHITLKGKTSIYDTISPFISICKSKILAIYESLALLWCKLRTSALT